MSTVRLIVTALVLCAVVPACRVQAQTASAPGGFNLLVRPYATGAERQAQDGLWIFELSFRSMRMLELDLTNPATGQKQKELLYYLTYKAVNREIETRMDATDSVPVNDYDKDPVPDLFVPQLTLVTEDNGVRRVVGDSILPQAQSVIRQRERLPLLNSVESVQKLPAVVPLDAEDAEAFYGVAMFRGVDPDTDFFSVFLSGFSNGYKLVRGPVAWDDLRQLARSGEIRFNDQVWDGRLEADWTAAASTGDLFNPDKAPPVNADQTQWYFTVTSDRADDTVTVWRKTLLMKFWRPGDRFDQSEREIRLQGDPRWIYRPEDAPAPDAAPVSETALKTTVPAAAVSVR